MKLFLDGNMNEIQELYNVLANQTKITEAREEDCNLNDLISN